MVVTSAQTHKQHFAIQPNTEYGIDDSSYTPCYTTLGPNMTVGLNTTAVRCVDDKAEPDWGH